MKNTESASDDQLYTVTELNENIKQLLETSFPYGVRVIGEIRNYKHHSSGHRYFLLVDEDAQINCVIWRSIGRNLEFQLKEGLNVEVHGKLSVYPKRGEYQIYVKKITPKGKGNKALKFKKLKKKLKKEGLFEDKYKKDIPDFPKRVGVVTAKTGAAITDIVNVITRRAPYIQILIRNTQVQGEKAAEDIKTAIQEFNEYQDIDILIVGRGGGSQEDLWCFNEEKVARAIFDSEIPIISSVGHEIDFSISDFVADLRAPTPSAAAELVAPNTQEIKTRLDSMYEKLANRLLRIIEQNRNKLENQTKRYGFREPLQLVYEKGQYLDDLESKFVQIADGYFTEMSNKLNLLSAKLDSLSPYNVLERGYSITSLKETDEIIKNKKQVSEGDKIITRLMEGEIESEVNE